MSGRYVARRRRPCVSTQYPHLCRSTEDASEVVEAVGLDTVPAAQLLEPDRGGVQNPGLAAPDPVGEAEAVGIELAPAEPALGTIWALTPCESTD